MARCIRPDTCTLIRFARTSISAHTWLNIFVRAARVKSVRINWQTLNSLCVFELGTHTTGDETLFQVSENASDKNIVFLCAALYNVTFVI